MAATIRIRLTDNFSRNLESLREFLASADAASAFDELLATLLDTVLPNLERFPAIGRPFLDHAVLSVETGNALAAIKHLHAGLTLREYLLAHYVILYAESADALTLLSIRHQRQLSFDFDGVWTESRR